MNDLINAGTYFIYLIGALIVFSVVAAIAMFAWIVKSRKKHIDDFNATRDRIIERRKRNGFYD